MLNPTSFRVQAPLPPAGVRSVVFDDIGAFADERSFMALSEAYEESGGVIWADDLDRVIQDSGNGHSLAKLLASGQVLSFRWRDETWIPMAQFEAGSLVQKAGFLEVWSELANDIDGWEVAAWFARRNTSLGGQRPVDVFSSNLSAVLIAARTDRFVRRG